MDKYQAKDCFTWEDEDGFGHFVIMDENRTDAEREMFKRILELETEIQKNQDYDLLMLECLGGGSDES